jgi:hypothetical protein
MTPTTITSRVGADGILSVAIPPSLAAANEEVRVTIEPINPKPAMTQEEWAAWVKSMAGSWQGDFERPDQGTFEERDALP